MKITVYTSENCTFCKLQKEFMLEKGLEYTNVNIYESKEKFDAFKSEDGIGTPLTIVEKDNGEKVKIHGFNLLEIEKQLQLSDNN